MVNIKKIRYLLIPICLLSALPAQKAIQVSPASEKQIGMASGVYINYGTAGTEADGYFEFQTRSGLFIESSAITQFSKFGTLNTSIGLMKEYSDDLFIVGGYSNYFEINESLLNEVFFGYSSSTMTSVVFFGLGSEISPNYLGILNLNSFLPDVSFDSSLLGIISKDLNEFGYDLFLNITKTFSSGFTYGVSTSNERYQTEESQTFKKNGNEKTFTIPVVRQGSFISVFVGWTF
tara:strand:- start:981 stop:1682 length:702 start_codon:yes stop_codon:yes gene_type:complete